MSKYEKALARIKTHPKDFTYDELRTLLEHIGFVEHTKGRTSGSSVSFVRPKDNKVFMFHKPHPGNIVKPCYVKQLYKLLKEIGVI